MEQDTAIT